MSWRPSPENHIIYGLDLFVSRRQEARTYRLRAILQLAGARFQFFNHGPHLPQRLWIGQVFRNLPEARCLGAVVAPPPGPLGAAGFFAPPGGRPPSAG